MSEVLSDKRLEEILSSLANDDNCWMEPELGGHIQAQNERITELEQQAKERRALNKALKQDVKDTTRALAEQIEYQVRLERTQKEIAEYIRMPEDADFQGYVCQLYRDHIALFDGNGDLIRNSKDVEYMRKCAALADAVKRLPFEWFLEDGAHCKFCWAVIPEDKHDPDCPAAAVLAAMEILDARG